MANVMQLYTIRNLLLPLLVTTSDEINQFKQYRDENGVFVWESTSNFVPVQSTTYGNMTIGNEMSVEFDFIYNGPTDPGQTDEENFFRIGYSSTLYGNGCGGKLYTYPAFFIMPDDQEILFRLTDSSSCGSTRDLSEFGAVSTSIPYHFKSTWNESNLLISIDDGTTEWTHRESLPGLRSDDIGDVVPVWWMSDKFNSEYTIGNGTFWNITITSKLYTLSDMSLYVHILRYIDHCTLWNQ